jgi:hypothetical protein
MQGPAAAALSGDGAQDNALIASFVPRLAPTEVLESRR